MQRAESGKEDHITIEDNSRAMKKSKIGMPTQGSLHDAAIAEQLVSHFTENSRPYLAETLYTSLIVI